MKNKQKILLTSMVTIVLCLCLIAGSTYALFTDREVMNIAVTSGKVDITASIVNPVISYIEGDANGSFVVADSNIGEKFRYNVLDETLTADATTGEFEGSFNNGGTVSYGMVLDSNTNAEVPTLTIDKITPGDKIKVQIAGTNESDVNAKYRCKIEIVGGDKEILDGEHGLSITIDGVKYEYKNGFVSDWADLAIGNGDVTFCNVVIELPVEAGNEYQGLSASFAITLEAVQANAVAN